jgi:hypothetical protein
MMTTDQIVISSFQPLCVTGVRHGLELSRYTAVAGIARKNQIPNAIKIVKQLTSLKHVGEEVIYI